MRFKFLHIMLCMALLLVLPGLASGQCEPDSHNDATTAIRLEFDESISDYVCPDDPFDYYYFEVPDVGDVSGMITFEATRMISS